VTATNEDLEARLVHLETKMDFKLDRMQERLNLLILTAAGVMVTITVLMLSLVITLLHP